MKDNPLIVSLLLGLIVVLLIGGVSLSFGLKKSSDLYKKELAKKVSLEKTIEDLKAESDSLKNTIAELNTKVETLNLQIKSLTEENIKVETLKNKIEENLKEELMKQKLPEG